MSNPGILLGRGFGGQAKALRGASRERRVEEVLSESTVAEASREPEKFANAKAQYWGLRMRLEAIMLAFANRTPGILVDYRQMSETASDGGQMGEDETDIREELRRARAE